MKSKHQMARKIQRAFYKMKKLRLLKTIFKSIRRIQTLYRVRKEYKKFRDKQKKLRKLQKWFKRTIFKKNLERSMQIQSKKRKLVVKLSSLYRMKTQRRKYLQIFSSNLLITKYVRGFLARRKLKNLKCVKRSLTIGLIFEKAWNIIKRKWEKEAAVVIQRYARGYLVRKLKKKEIAHMKKFRFCKKLRNIR